MRKTLEELRKTLTSHKSELEERYKVKDIGLFGSYVKNEQKKSSDIDVLVEFKETPTLIKFVNLENYLSDLLELKVDLVMKKALKPHIGRAILEEVTII